MVVLIFTVRSPLSGNLDEIFKGHKSVGNEIKVATKVNLRDSDGNHGKD